MAHLKEITLLEFSRVIFLRVAQNRPTSLPYGAKGTTPTLVLSASLITFGVADCVMDTPQVASASSLESRLAENLTSIEDGRNINEIIDIRQCRHNHGVSSHYGYQNATYVYAR